MFITENRPIMLVSVSRIVVDVENVIDSSVYERD